MEKFTTILGVLIAIILFGAIGGSIFVPFADIFMESNPFIPHALGGALLLFGGIVVGVIVKKYWYLAGGCAWLALLLSLPILVGVVRSPISGIYFIIAVYMILPIALSLLGGYIGFRIRNRLS
ncbi:hypothetical protein KAX08_05000, partial [candidate division WOR-3 bacterium]|nr:hypothetical protein [candidate division WOR-3 bacterium]